MSNGAIGRFPETRDERGQSGFAAAGGTDNRERRTGGDFAG